jgi:hypothetical protein
MHLELHLKLHLELHLLPDSNKMGLCHELEVLLLKLIDRCNELDSITSHPRMTGGVLGFIIAQEYEG